MKHINYRDFVTYLVSIALLLSGQLLIIRSSQKRLLENLETEEKFTNTYANSGLLEGISQVLQELSYLSTDEHVVSYAQDRTIELEQDVKKIFQNISASTAIYDQIRILGLDGIELIRVDYEDGSPVVVPTDSLQDKSSRDYFIDCKAIPADGIYISKLDLNIENGEVEIPYRPMIRVCTPITDKNKEVKAYLILNYNAAQMLEGLTKVDQNIMLINCDGYWLVSPQPEDEWGFVFGKEDNFISKYPEDWQRINASQTGQFNSKNGLWTYSTVFPLKDAVERNSHLQKNVSFNENTQISDQYYWKVVSFSSSDSLDKLRKEIARPILLASLIIYPSAIFGILNYVQRIKYKRQSSEHIRYMATHDMMTDLFNRAFFEAEIERLNLGRSYPVSIIMMDANNLKIVNDTLGHQAGDQMLKNVGTILRESFRTEDILARIGGDEFAVILPLTDINESKKIISRFLNYVQNFNHTDSVIKVDLAIGCATSNEEEDLEAVIKRADEEMYQDKALRKGRGKHSD